MRTGQRASPTMPKVVYDTSETSAKDRQQEQEPKSMRELVSALIDASPVPCVPVGELELPAYYDSSQQTILSRKGFRGSAVREYGKRSVGGGL